MSHAQRFVLFAIAVLPPFIWSAPAAPAVGAELDLKSQFLRLCDQQAKIVDRQARAAETGRQFYKDAYAVRALAVAYDMTGRREYLDVCRRWADRMLRDQSRMIPKGAYYMNYGRAPGQDKGNWYVADSAAIAMGVLATAVRCDDPAEKSQYLDSVKAFAKLVIDNWVGPGGGIANGHWPKSDKEWWCSTGCFGAMAFLLYDATGDESYLKIGLGTIDWLNRYDLLAPDPHYPPEAIKPTVMMYCLEAYSAAFPYLKPESERFKPTMAQWTRSLDWITRNQAGRAETDYLSQWGSKLGGLPCHMYIYSTHVAGQVKLARAADEELGYVARLLEKSSASPGRDQLAAFAMMAYAEKLRPGVLYGDHGTPAETDEP
jgi:hypothetical protein